MGLDFIAEADVSTGHEDGVGAAVQGNISGGPGRGRSQKILIHAINFAPELIGCGKYTTELAQFLEARGHIIEIVTAPPHYPGWFVRAPYQSGAYVTEIFGSMRVTRCPMTMKTGAPGLWRLIAPLSFAAAAAPMVVWRIFRFRPHIVICVEPTLMSAPAALIAAKLCGARSLLHVQDLEVDAAFEVGHLNGGAIRRVANIFESWFLARFDRVVTISQKMQHALLAKGLSQQKVSVLRNWVDTAAIVPEPRTTNAFREELGIPSDAFVVLYAGNLGPKQALDMLIAAARRLAGECDIYCVIAGAGPMLDALQTQSADLPNVRFLPLQPAERMSELLALADLHVLPQLKGAADLVLPSKLGGMLASGRPIVATADPGTELYEMLQDIALLPPTGDIDSLAEAISAARTIEWSQRVERGLCLAETMSANSVLPRYETLLSA
ncbi:colanic acid biosynthesis glycosyl transferase WcaI [Methylosinus sp. sav-2]|uniref:WcaI family glycosyltransferase n=1 Tax=Methylosinus sp. sav-2 TaxID=2485168 RepID=UPI000A03D20D|nr:WcaI family glycosyltransferase [Methylosinus sp. sav-2]TDX62138.1 colanic acid biosynthesis glycosyl transferase WcaI [Methylosinus sp. sav-2]